MELAGGGDGGDAPADAVGLDTTGNTFEQSCRQILEIIRERIAL